VCEHRFEVDAVEWAAGHHQRVRIRCCVFGLFVEHVPAAWFTEIRIDLLELCDRVLVDQSLALGRCTPAGLLLPPPATEWQDQC
jgi:hypothetical protein